MAGPGVTPGIRRYSKLMEPFDGNAKKQQLINIYLI
jgi:hypothetical protein